jgi:hypothetical protein
MTRKANNSILFLTTLSVYLGLVLVGGSPSVFAHAALTPRFELVNEFETDDDLDKKPDGEQIVADYVKVCEEFLRLAKQFTDENRDRLSESKYEFDYSIVNDPKSALVLRSVPPVGTFWTGFTRPLIALGKTIPSVKDQSAERSRVTLSYSDSEFSLRTAFNQDDSVQPERLSAFYNLIVARRLTEPDPRLIIYKNTTITHDNDQIVVVTRLPRASIDDLLAEKQSR